MTQRAQVIVLGALAVAMAVLWLNLMVFIIAKSWGTPNPQPMPPSMMRKLMMS